MSSSTQPRVKKSLGQHFLHRTDICERIVGLLALQQEDRLIEIGPGSGALTRELENAPHRLLLLLEKDSYWIAERSRSGASVTLPVHMDALHFDWGRITPEYPWKIVGNLPYNIASRLVWDIARKAAGLTKAVFMVQNEVGERIAAPPANRHYGAISVWVQSLTRPRLEFTVDREAFTPPPKVQSVVLSLEPLSLGKRPPYPSALARLLQICFQQRRKQIGVIFKQSGFTELVAALDILGIDPIRRPETLTPEEFQQLCDVVYCIPSSKKLKKIFAFENFLR
ncbi:MAG: 16S rRNA (adenine(1518)-N(6)/adenine(1519)-N(6))-dimethyltransferase RsmA [Desulfovibrio sp.]|nr:16S rRNA (adenine(1518)-N(6)/adenine(1519)-N(6))-dimethyltransferase RsmA [Desulfovibrio sp.]